MPSQRVLLSIYREQDEAKPSGALDASTGGWARASDGTVIFVGPYSQDGLFNAERNNLNKQTLNRMVRFQAEDYLVLGGRIYRWNQGITAWETELVLTVADSGSSNNLGLYPMNIDNVPYLVTAYQHGATSTWESIRLNGDTNVWESGTTDTVLTASDAGGAILNEILYDNKIYFLTSSTSNYGIYDPQLQSFLLGTFSEANQRHPMDLCVYSGLLYCLNKNSSRDILVHQINSTVTERVLVLGRPHPSGDRGPTDLASSPTELAPTATSNLQGRNAMFVDNWNLITPTGVFGAGPHPPRMYACQTVAATGAEGGTWALFEMEGDGLGGLQEKRRIDDRLNFAFAGGNNEDEIVRIFHDQKTRWENEGTFLEGPYIYFEVRNQDTDIPDPPADPGGLFSPYSNFQWTPNITTNNGGPEPVGIMPQDAGFFDHSHFSWPHDKMGHGARVSEQIPASGAVDVRMVDIGLRSIEPVDNAVRIVYEVFPASAGVGGTPIAVRWYYDLDGHTPQEQCNIVATSSGTIGADGVIRGQSIGHVYSCDWDAASQGISRFTKAKLLGFASMTGVV